MKLLLIILLLGVYFILWCMLKISTLEDNIDNNILDEND